jgi:NADPH-dependent 7-cyano-7-deazaguanine reductase QueF-like protein
MESKSFKLVLNSNYRQSILVDNQKQTVLKVISEPIFKYGQWYFKILNKLTFGKRFNNGWEHYVEIIS